MIQIASYLLTDTWLFMIFLRTDLNTHDTNDVRTSKGFFKDDPKEKRSDDRRHLSSTLRAVPGTAWQKARSDAKDMESPPHFSGEI